jgi:midasin (ATPase involved in ribosome maturation)
MSDNKTRQIALESLNTISSALALLEAGQLGVLRYRVRDLQCCIIPFPKMFSDMSKQDF